MSVVFGVILTIIVSLAINEFTDFLPSMATGLARLAARRLPSSKQARYAEEWLAELESVPGRLSRLFKATSLLVVSRRLGKAMTESEGSLPASAASAPPPWPSAGEVDFKLTKADLIDFVQQSNVPDVYLDRFRTGLRDDLVFSVNGERITVHLKDGGVRLASSQAAKRSSWSRLVRWRSGA